MKVERSTLDAVAEATATAVQAALTKAMDDFTLPIPLSEEEEVALAEQEALDDEVNDEAAQLEEDPAYYKAKLKFWIYLLERQYTDCLDDRQLTQASHIDYPPCTTRSRNIKWGKIRTLYNKGKILGQTCIPVQKVVQYKDGDPVNCPKGWMQSICEDSHSHGMPNVDDSIPRSQPTMAITTKKKVATATISKPTTTPDDAADTAAVSPSGHDRKTGHKARFWIKLLEGEPKSDEQLAKAMLTEYPGICGNWLLKWNSIRAAYNKGKLFSQTAAPAKEAIRYNDDGTPYKRTRVVGDKPAKPAKVEGAPRTRVIDKVGNASKPPVAMRAAAKATLPPASVRNVIKRPAKK